jgi:hypothetical protein
VVRARLEHVTAFLDRWKAPAGADLRLDASDPLAANISALVELIEAR